MSAYQLPERPFHVEKLDWPSFVRRFRRRFDQGDAVTILGGPESGKTHLGILIAEMRTYTFFMATKPRDPLVAALARRRWAVSTTLEPVAQNVEVTDGEGKPVYNPDGTRKLEPLYPRYVFWPAPTPVQAPSLEEESEFIRAEVQRALVLLKQLGSWCVILDETNYLTDTLSMRKDLSQFWHIARTNLLTVLAHAQRPSWIPRAALDNPNHFFIFQASDRQELQRLGEVTGGLDWRPMAEEIASLNWKRHEFLYVSSKDRIAFRSIAPPW